MGSFKSFEELACWKESRILRNYVKDEIIPLLPDSEKFGLASQIQRSSRSVGNNIAEGFGRFNYQENIQFCRMARGSLNETLDHMIIALDENYIEEEKLNNFRGLYNRTLKILNGYIKYLRDAKLKFKPITD
ncbi:four helix bundle protein [Muricauda oceani]|uniref:Four helix bundle protein n=1 Tax=Flagellimonas oceani TaxID=2698672 RepID=A0A6G7J700_9FLAO|nr:four helix bundle protein [Allomuricauda oceani]MBW8245024.1 four helix bundle protein [Allomuricauda oceani]QII46470.1 four helix bundle protein [Allomuricauda oceani]